MVGSSDEFLTIGPAAAEVSRLTGRYVAPSTIRDWADRGKLPCTRTPTGLRLFIKRELQLIIVERLREPA
jgi:hypothetical protein